MNPAPDQRPDRGQSPPAAAAQHSSPLAAPDGFNDSCRSGNRVTGRKHAFQGRLHGCHIDVDRIAARPAQALEGFQAGFIDPLADGTNDYIRTDYIFTAFDGNRVFSVLSFFADQFCLQASQTLHSVPAADYFTWNV